MDFKLTEEQELIKQSVSEFVDELSGEKVMEVLKTITESGFSGIFFKEEVGGAGGDFTSYLLALEEMAKFSPSAALAYAINNTQVSYALNEFGSEELQKNYLTKLVQGEAFGAYAYSEQGIGDDLLSIDTTAILNNGFYELNGSKTFVLNGGQADVYIVFANTNGGLSAFVVDSNLPGVSFDKPYTKMGLDEIPAVTMHLKNVRVPSENLIGKEGLGKTIAEKISEVHNISLAAIAVAISETAMEKSISYGKERIQFKVPIITFDAAHQKIGEMATNIEAAQLLIFKAAHSFEEGEGISEVSKMAKYFAVKTGQDIVREAVQIHGGYGYTKDLGVEKLFRDLKGLDVIESIERPLVLQIADEKIG